MSDQPIVTHVRVPVVVSLTYARMGDASTEVLADADHLIEQEFPAALAELIEDAVAGVFKPGELIDQKATALSSYAQSKPLFSIFSLDN